MSRILFLGDVAGTGFGTVTRDLGTALLARGEDVRFLSINEMPGELEEPFAGRTALMGDPNGWLGYGNPETASRLEGMCTGGLFEDGWTPDALIALGDPGSLVVSPVLGFIPEGFPAFHYVPIEGVGLTPSWRLLWQRIVPVACATNGADAIAALGLPRPPVVYHGVNTDDFYPASPERPIYLPTRTGLKKLRSKDACRDFLGIPAEWIVLFRADRHMPRKMYASLLRAIAPVMRDDERVHFIYHARTMDEGGNLIDEIAKYGPLVGYDREAQFPTFGGVAGRMHRTGAHDLYGGATRALLNVMYNAADLYVSASAEGFGLTIAEAIAAGTPALGMDFSSVPEVIGPAGAVVPIDTLLDNIYSYFWARVDEAAYTAKVRELIADLPALRALGAKGPGHVRSSFSWTRAAEQFSDLVASALPSAVPTEVAA